MKKVINIIKKNIFGIIICGIIFGSVGVYAGTKFYASDVSVNAPTGSSLGSNATLQDSLDELYSIAGDNEKINTRLTNLENKKSTIPYSYYGANVSVSSGTLNTLKKVTLPAGTYIIFFQKCFVGSSSGYRQIILSFQPDVDWAVDTILGASSSGLTTVTMTVPIVLSKSATLQFMAQQNSGVTLSGCMYYQIVKLI